MTRWKPDAAGRLVEAAIALFEAQGYDETSVAEIAQRAGLTKRTFFRYFPDKREVLFAGSSQLVELWVDAVAAAPAGAPPIAAACAGFRPVGELFSGRFDVARVRARIIEANPELMERELRKLEALAGAVGAALAARGAHEGEAALAAQSAVAVFRVGFSRWVRQGDPDALTAQLDDALDELRAVIAG